MLNAEIMARYALAKDWRSAGFHETENHRQIGRAVRAGLGSGRLIAITGPIGVGKTVTTVPTLIAALFYDLSPEKDLKIPTQGEKRERELRKLVLRGGKPVALFIDEAHDLHSRTLNGLMRLMEVIARGGGSLSVVLIGHPKLRNDLRRPTMEEIGHRTDILSFEGLGEDARAYLDWLLGECTEADTDVDALIEPAGPGPDGPQAGHTAAVCRAP